MGRRGLFYISRRQAGMIVDALHGRDRFGRKLRPKAKAQQKIVTSKPNTPPKPLTKEEKENAKLITVMMASVFIFLVLSVFGVRGEIIVGAIVIAVLIILMPNSLLESKATKLSKEQQLRYEWAVKNNFWGSATHDERTFLNNQTVTLERQYQEYLRQKMEQGFIGSEAIEEHVIKEQTIENVKQAKQNLWKKLDRIDKTSLSKTVIEFANESNVPVDQVWADLKKLGISPPRDQHLSLAIQDHLSAIYQKASSECDKAEAIKLKRQEFNSKMLRQKEEYEAIRLKQQEEIKANAIKLSPKSCNLMTSYIK